jgi:ATP-dependent Clp protease ATP-binding subunit ClpX
MDSLNLESYIKILKEPKNAILKQYQKLLELDEVKLNFDDSALEAIAKKAMERETGARALRAIIEEFMLDIMYEIPKDENIGEVTITGDYINGKGGPVIEIRTEQVHQKPSVEIEQKNQVELQKDKKEEHNFYEF